MLFYAAAFTLIASIFAIGAAFLWKPLVVGTVAFLFGTVSALLHISESREVCERTDGGVSPFCGERNPVTWLS